MPVPPSPQANAEFIWMDGDFVPWEEARIHALSHVLHYGSSVFEGIRCYKGEDGSHLFRLRDHLERLYDSARFLRMEIGYDLTGLQDVCAEVIARNRFDSCYVRPLVFRGAGSMGVLGANCPIHVMVAAWPWGAYLGADALEQGIDAMVSSWRKIPPGSIPALAKIGGAYVLSSLAKMDAHRLGFAEAILLDTEGRLAEGSGENLFLVKDDKLLTPPLSNSVLAGITRASVVALAHEAGIEVVETSLTRGHLYLADEVFFTGTAAEVTPVRSVDGHVIGSGAAGPVTKRLQQAFFDVVYGRTADRFGWLTPVKLDLSPRP